MIDANEVATIHIAYQLESGRFIHREIVKRTLIQPPIWPAAKPTAKTAATPTLPKRTDLRMVRNLHAPCDAFHT
jgi:hypothetical protein